MWSVSIEHWGVCILSMHVLIMNMIYSVYPSLWLEFEVAQVKSYCLLI